MHASQFFTFGLASLATVNAFVPIDFAELDQRLEPRQASNPSNIMMFNCANLPEVCSNMCYGAYCLNIKSTLSYDKPTQQIVNARRRNAGCGTPNRCSTKKGHQPGYQCDEYPFARTVSRGGSTARVNRCVPKKQNRSQGGTISKFYGGKYCGGGPCDFTAGFENPGGIKYCNANTGGSCKADSNEVQGRGGNSKRDTDNTPPFPRYRLASGGEITVPSGAFINQTVIKVMPINETLWQEHIDSHVDLDDDEDDDGAQYNYMHSNLREEEDKIVGEIED